MPKPANVDEYIAAFPAEVQKVLKEVRATVKKAAPEATEIISYSMPAYKLNGMVAWFAGHTTHLGFYPGVSGIAAFQKELSTYKHAKGSVQFPFDNKMPTALIAKIVRYRVNENMLKPKRK